jgi:ligand-binding SRPBCC domain-containing protein
MSKTFTHRDTILIQAPIQRCFELSTSIEVVRRELHMEPVEGKRNGHVVLNDRILWRGWKFGLPQMHESLISAFEAPNFFQDTMLRGRFQAFQHDHHFTPTDTGTLLEDEIRFSLPFGFAGDLVARLILLPYIRNVLHRRFQLLKSLAETDAWRTILEVPHDTNG